MVAPKDVSHFFQLVEFFSCVSQKKLPKTTNKHLCKNQVSLFYRCYPLFFHFFHSSPSCITTWKTFASFITPFGQNFPGLLWKNTSTTLTIIKTITTFEVFFNDLLNFWTDWLFGHNYFSKKSTSHWFFGPVDFLDIFKMTGNFRNFYKDPKLIFFFSFLFESVKKIKVSSWSKQSICPSIKSRIDFLNGQILILFSKIVDRKNILLNPFK